MTSRHVGRWPTEEIVMQRIGYREASKNGSASRSYGEFRNAERIEDAAAKCNIMELQLMSECYRNCRPSAIVARSAIPKRSPSPTRATLSQLFHKDVLSEHIFVGFSIDSRYLISYRREWLWKSPAMRVASAFTKTESRFWLCLWRVERCGKSDKPKARMVSETPLFEKPAADNMVIRFLQWDASRIVVFAQHQPLELERHSSFPYSRIFADLEVPFTEVFLTCLSIPDLSTAPTPLPSLRMAIRSGKDPRGSARFSACVVDPISHDLVTFIVLPYALVILKSEVNFWKGVAMP